MVLITVILDGFLFKYEVNKMNEKLLKYFKNVWYETAEKLAGYPSAKNKLARTSALEWQNPPKIVQSCISRWKSMHMEKHGILE